MHRCLFELLGESDSRSKDCAENDPLADGPGREAAIAARLFEEAKASQEVDGVIRAHSERLALHLNVEA